MKQTVKNALKQLLYRVGGLGLLHRVRNRNALTVVLFHRVLSRTDPRWEDSLAEWTVSDTMFRGCLAFFKRHYNVVPIEDLLDSYRTGRALPPRSLLITFDDGYADNAEYALPLLREHGLPAVVFVFSDAVGRATRPWTEDLIAAHARGDVAAGEIALLYRALFPGSESSPESERAMLGQIVERWPALPDDRLTELLRHFAKPVRRRAIPEQMASAAQLRALQAGGVTIASHGKTHTALPLSPDLDVELTAPRRALADVLGLTSADEIATLAFPYGMHSDTVVERALGAGYDLVFTLVPELHALHAGRLTSRVIGRANVSEPALAPDGRVRPEVLALHFFRLPHRSGSP